MHWIIKLVEMQFLSIKSAEPQTITLSNQDIWYSGCAIFDEDCPLKLRKCNMEDETTIHSISLQCFSGQFINVESAVYGRRDSSLCCQGK
jgi:hypothetical protein